MSNAALSLLRTLFLLVISAALEVGGDAGMRAGLHGRRSGFVIGILLLALYGIFVNLPKWDFGRLMGIYIAIFFLVSQAIAVFSFHENLKAPTLVGGALIIAGGLVLTFWKG